ncbi:hypothetical protein K9M79_00390 [Candidatus Woesearchaeota archaeon]|nr:hypothetical protein [Candidatus Woesearchaeota archaeon]
MRVTNDLITKVVAQVAGEEVNPLVEYLKNKKNISEFKIAEAIETPINIVRNMLYRLYDHNLVTVYRKKDRQKGWYIHYWTFNPKRIKSLIVSLKKQKLDRLLDRLKREKESDFYICDSRCMRLDFEQAMDFEFKCPECGEIMNQEADQNKRIEEISQEIAQLEKDLKKES